MNNNLSNEKAGSGLHLNNLFKKNNQNKNKSSLFLSLTQPVVLFFSHLTCFKIIMDGKGFCKLK
jgi:hypothetical protein